MDRRAQLTGAQPAADPAGPRRVYIEAAVLSAVLTTLYAMLVRSWPPDAWGMLIPVLIAAMIGHVRRQRQIGKVGQLSIPPYLYGDTYANNALAELAAQLWPVSSGPWETGAAPEPDSSPAWNVDRQPHLDPSIEWRAVAGDEDDWLGSDQEAEEPSQGQRVYMPAPYVPSDLRAMLLPGERVFWTGRPKPSLMPRVGTLITNLVLCYFGFPDLFQYLSAMLNDEPTGSFPYVGAVFTAFVLIGSVDLAVALLSRLSTYALTSHRALHLRKAPFAKLHSLLLTPATRLELHVTSNGLGRLLIENRLSLNHDVRRVPGYTPGWAVKQEPFVTFYSVEHPYYVESMANWIVDMLAYQTTQARAMNVRSELYRGAS